MKCGDETFSFFFAIAFKDMNLFFSVNIRDCIRNTFFIAVIMSMIKLCGCPCDRAEYEINGECCPMCGPGNRVYRHCTEFTSTTCTGCADQTYTAEANGLSFCLSCTVCDSAQGLRVKTPCTRTADTICEPLDGYYCIDQHPYSCGQAREHTKCKPGQYIKSKGTALTDTVCDWCKAGTFSDGSLEICQKFLKCEDLGLIELKPGTNYSDVVCGKDDTVPAVIGGGGVVVVVVVLVILGLMFWKRKKRTRTRNQSEPEPNAQTIPLHTPIR